MYFDKETVTVEISNSKPFFLKKEKQKNGKIVV